MSSSSSAAAAESNLGQISSSAAAFPRRPLLLPADRDRVLVSWLGRRWLLMELKKMSVCSRGEILTPFSLFQEVVFLLSSMPFFSPDADKVVHCGTISLEYYG